MAYNRCECGTRKNEDYDFCSICSAEEVEIGFDFVANKTDAAYLISAFGETIWLPKSQVAALKEDFDGGTCWIPRWLASEKELV